MNITRETVYLYILTGIAALFAIMFHEIAHGFIAFKLGDNTAKKRGRLSLNPLKHIDWVGLLMLIVVQFGWAKPVPVDIRYFKNPRVGMALVALAGPVMNFIMALFSTIMFSVLRFYDAPSLLVLFFYLGVIINIGLGMFNLFPIPPLDGSKILGIILPARIHIQILRYEKYGIILLILLLWTGILGEPLIYLRGTVLDRYMRIDSWLISFLSQTTGV
jgi:Zn-dependent protease